MKKFACGVDLGWISQLEDNGFCWVDAQGEKVDPIQASKDMGADSVRLRVFVDPPEGGYWQKDEQTVCMLGYCDAQGVLNTAKRVKEKGMRLMIDFHYSDVFADPVYQYIPAAWAEDDDEKLAGRVFRHTKEVLSLLKEHDICPEWVQVGNEINPGLMLPRGGLKENPEALVTFLNAGYDAVKACFPECQVITHLAGVDNKDWCVPFLENFFKQNGKTDILGFSYYPYWYQSKSDKAVLFQCLKDYADAYQKPVMVVEVGGEDCDEEGSYQLVKETLEAVSELPGQQGLGVFYWEPEVNREIMPDKYPLGAARLLDEHTLQYTKVLTAYREMRGEK